MSNLKNWVLSLIDNDAKTDIEIQLFVEKSSDECKSNGKFLSILTDKKDGFSNPELQKVFSTKDILITGNGVLPQLRLGKFDEPQPVLPKTHKHYKEYKKEFEKYFENSLERLRVINFENETSGVNVSADELDDLNYRLVKEERKEFNVVHLNKYIKLEFTANNINAALVFLRKFVAVTQDNHWNTTILLRKKDYDNQKQYDCALSTVVIEDVQSINDMYISTQITNQLIHVLQSKSNKSQKLKDFLSLPSGNLGLLNSILGKDIFAELELADVEKKEINIKRIKDFVHIFENYQNVFKKITKDQFRQIRKWINENNIDTSSTDENSNAIIEKMAELLKVNPDAVMNINQFENFAQFKETGKKVRGELITFDFLN